MDYTPIIRTIPDFPKQGVKFHDITPLLKNGELFSKLIEEFAEHYKNSGIRKIVSTEARGFIFGAALAYRLGVGFVPIRKGGKLPGEIIKSSNDIEYGKRDFEMHNDSIESGEKILILDDLLATGGTTQSAIEMVKSLGGDIVGLAFFIVMSSLCGLEKFKDYDVFYLVDDRDLE
jgi:adenine phosphoribosyltransferase